MPIYEYRCGSCGHEFEEWQKINDKPIRKCPKCNLRKVDRLVSMSSFQLKGGGWYVTDYARRGNGAGGEGKRDSRPASEDSKASKPKSKAKSAKSSATSTTG